MPSDRGLLHLDSTPRSALHVVPENLLNLAQPTHIKRLCHIQELVVIRRLDKASMFCGQAKVRDVSPVFFEKVAVTSRNEVNDIFGVSGEGGYGCAGTLGRDSL